MASLSRDPRGGLAALRRRAVNGLVQGAFTGLGRVARRVPGHRPGDLDVDVYRDLRYAPGEHPLQRLDVYRPAGLHRPLPVVLYLHGGGFRFGDKESHAWFGARYAAAGFVCVLPSYRLAPRDPYPAAVQDARAALEWTIEHIGRVGGDPDNVQVAGESAGGNLALTLALATATPLAEPSARALFEARVRLRGATVAAGLLQVSDPGRFRRRRPTLPAWLDDEIWAAALNWLGPHRLDGADASCPLRWIEGDTPTERPLPPVFAFCGTGDPLLDDTRRLVAALRARGAPVDHALYPGERHVFHTDVWRRPAREAWRASLDFARRVADAR